jgi:hypothetical protein
LSKEVNSESTPKKPIINGPVKSRKNQHDFDMERAIAESLAYAESEKLAESTAEKSRGEEVII